MVLGALLCATTRTLRHGASAATCARLLAPARTVASTRAQYEDAQGSGNGSTIGAGEGRWSWASTLVSSLVLGVGAAASTAVVSAEARSDVTRSCKDAVGGSTFKARNTHSTINPIETKPWDYNWDGRANEGEVDRVRRVVLVRCANTVSFTDVYTLVTN